MYVILQIIARTHVQRRSKLFMATLFEAGEKNLNFHVLERSLNKSGPMRPKERKLIDQMEEPGGWCLLFRGRNIRAEQVIQV